MFFSLTWKILITRLYTRDKPYHASCTPYHASCTPKNWKKIKKTESTYNYAGNKFLPFFGGLSTIWPTGVKIRGYFLCVFISPQTFIFFPSYFWVSPRGERAAPRRNPEILGKKINILGEIKSEKKTPVCTSDFDVSCIVHFDL